MHHYQNRTIKHITQLKIEGQVAYMNDVGYHTFLNDVIADTLHRCSYNWWIMSMDNVQYRTITKICKETIIQEIMYKYNEECNAFVLEVSSDVFMMLQHKPIFIAVKGLWSTDIWKEICLLGTNMARKCTWLQDLSSIHYGRKLSHVCGYIMLKNNYDVNVSWKGNIASLWVPLNDFVSTIAGDSNFTWPWDRLRWKLYLLIFPCI
jgi:hypothetical protein